MLLVLLLLFLLLLLVLPVLPLLVLLLMLLLTVSLLLLRSVAEFDMLLQNVAITHSLLSKHLQVTHAHVSAAPSVYSVGCTDLLSSQLQLDSFEMMLRETNDDVSLVSFHGRIVIHTLTELISDLFPNFVYNSYTRRFIRQVDDAAPQHPTEKMERPRGCDR